MSLACSFHVLTCPPIAHLPSLCLTHHCVWLHAHSCLDSLVQMWLTFPRFVQYCDCLGTLFGHWKGNSLSRRKGSMWLAKPLPCVLVLLYASSLFIMNYGCTGMIHS